MTPEIREGHVLDLVAELAPASVNCIVTSPPYWPQRKYKAPDSVWGATPGCVHDWTEHPGDNRGGSGPGAKESSAYGRAAGRGASCADCGAWSGQYGLEPTPDQYVAHTLEILAALWRVLRDDGVLWWVIGDAYAGRGPRRDLAPEDARDRLDAAGLKPKDLILMPQRVALAAQADGWFVRSITIWDKPNAMPESVQDRPVTAHEYIIMLTKRGRYWYDADAVRQPTVSLDPAHISYRPNSAKIAKEGRREFHDGKNTVSARSYNPAGRNLRSVWTITTSQTRERHYATFPLALPARCIAASCPHGGLVLDPFAGVGTTLIAAAQAGRRALGFELSPEYAAIARAKLATWWKPGTIVEPEVPEGQAALFD